jgi:hypothetical protein
MNSGKRFPGLLLIVLLLTLPLCARACPGRYSYDFGSPGSSPYQGEATVSYIIGRVLDIEPPNPDPRIGVPRKANIAIEVLTDYSNRKFGSRIEVDTRLGSCGNWLSVGQVAKFGIYDANGKLGLMTTEWGF